MLRAGSTAECTNGLSNDATVVSVEVLPDQNAIRLWVDDPHAKVDINPVWRQTVHAEAYHQPDRTMEGRG